MIRKSIFWVHLTAGLLAGTFIFLMSVTGVLLTYEPQIVTFAKSRAITPTGDATALGPDAMVAAVMAGGASAGDTLVFERRSGAPATLVSGRNRVTLDPYTGDRLETAGADTEALFRTITALHRWLSTTGRAGLRGALVDASNLVFLFLVVSGLYLWLPPAFRWTRLKTQMLFRRGLPGPQARHHNWHHVLGFWALVPLFFIVLSGVVMSYSWANKLVFAVAGTGGAQEQSVPDDNAGTIVGESLPYSALLAAAEAEVPSWRSASIVLPAADAAVLDITMDRGNGAQSAKRTELALDRASGDILRKHTGFNGPRGAQLRTWFRFVHTGEVYGILGQTIAGLASLAAAVLVYTGASLGLRRLRRMWRRRRTIRV